MLRPRDRRCPRTAIGGHIPTPLKHVLVRLSLIGLRTLAHIKNGFKRAGRIMAPAIQTAYSVLVRFLLLPAYKLLMLARLRVGRLFTSVRGAIFFVFTNRYVFHGMIAIISVGVIGTQLRTKEANAYEAGQKSLLYALVTQGQPSFVEETVRPELIVKDSHYLGSETVDASLGVDFHYATVAEDVPLADTSVPGAIALQPGAEDAGIPGTTQPEKRTKTETYIVREGDVIGQIAADFNVNVGTILWANGLTTRSTIRPGQALKIPPVSGVLHTVKSNDTLISIAKRYDANVDEIREANQLAPDAVLTLGEELVVPGGTPPTLTTSVAAAPSNVRSSVPISTISGKAYDLYQEVTGNSDDRARPDDRTEEPATTRLLWPTDHHQINQYFGWRHTGLDIHGRYENAIYASEDGVVEVAGWNSGGYGLMVLLNHGGGLKTRYAHASKLFVTAGQQVKRGEVLAMVGTTGRSTGPHLHYEVILNGSFQNPLAWTR